MDHDMDWYRPTGLKSGGTPFSQRYDGSGMGIVGRFHSASQNQLLPPNDGHVRVFNAMLYLAAAGCAWRLLPNVFRRSQWCRRYFALAPIKL